MARVVTTDVEFAGCPMQAGDKVLMNFPAANRDPAVFEKADTVVLDRAVNRHIAFGSGIHRCAGSNLARMELRVALEEWLRQIPDFAWPTGRRPPGPAVRSAGPASFPSSFAELAIAGCRPWPAATGRDQKRPRRPTNGPRSTEKHPPAVRLGHNGAHE